MMTAIYTVEYDMSDEQPKVFIQHRPAMALYSREAKRLRMGDVTWGGVSIKKWSFTGTPRSVTSASLHIGSMISKGVEVRQMIAEAEMICDIESEVLSEEVNEGLLT